MEENTSTHIFESMNYDGTDHCKAEYEEKYFIINRFTRKLKKEITFEDRACLPIGDEWSKLNPCGVWKIYGETPNRRLFYFCEKHYYDNKEKVENQTFAYLDFESCILKDN